jgi:hypothetical protein
MLKDPIVVMAMAARISLVVAAFSSWAPVCSDPIQRAVLKSVLEGILHQLVDESLRHSLEYGWAPFELVWENDIPLELEVVEGDDEDLVFEDPSRREYGKDRRGYGRRHRRQPPATLPQW